MTRPRPLELAARLLIAAALVLWLSHQFERSIVASMVPAFRSVITILEDEFTILAADVERTGSSETVEFRANLARPVERGGKTLYPFGWGTKPPGGFQVTLTTGGALQYCALMLIVVVAWPAGAREYFSRAAIGAPLFALLLLIPVPSTVLAGLWNLVLSDLEPGRIQPWLIWSRFLMGGGGLALGALSGAMTVALAARVSRASRPPHAIENAVAKHEMA